MTSNRQAKVNVVAGLAVFETLIYSLKRAVKSPLLIMHNLLHETAVFIRLNTQSEMLNDYALQLSATVGTNLSLQALSERN